ncbi:hypothetical protein ASJ81_06005 [Methanosarcina spelaei]|uniref:Uncharacterized protein n=1 Tax=Methanosarcina spelaei TaxID=1036679 RepID=A0A2A2HTI9_9EURY|nr:hypothetical protein ASJ81_06005 [Methanosarcina spelaei]
MLNSGYVTSSLTLISQTLSITVVLISVHRGYTKYPKTGDYIQKLLSEGAKQTQKEKYSYKLN